MSTTSEVYFSIIMPCYNSQYYVCVAIESVLNQSYSNLELLLIDDGSKDDTLLVLNEFASKDKRVKVFHKDNGGYPTAINYGLDRISGDYFLVIGSDDELCLDLLENAAKIIDKSHADMMVYKVRKHWVDNCKEDEIDAFTLFDKEIHFTGKYADFYKEYKYEASYFGIRDTGKIYKREQLTNLRYFGHYGYDADGIFALLFAHKCNSFAVMPVEGYKWNLHNDSLSGRTISINTQFDRLSNWANLVKSLKKIPKDELADIDYSYATIGHSIACNIGTINKKAFLKNYFNIYRYYFHLRTFCLKKSVISRCGIKIVLNSYFPLLFILLRIIKRS